MCDLNFTANGKKSEKSRWEINLFSFFLHLSIRLYIGNILEIIQIVSIVLQVGFDERQQQYHSWNFKHAHKLRRKHKIMAFIQYFIQDSHTIQTKYRVSFRDHTLWLFVWKIKWSSNVVSFRNPKKWDHFKTVKSSQCEPHTQAGIGILTRN